MSDEIKPTVRQSDGTVFLTIPIGKVTLEHSDRIGLRWVHTGPVDAQQGGLGFNRKSKAVTDLVRHWLRTHGQVED